MNQREIRARALVSLAWGLTLSLLVCACCVWKRSVIMNPVFTALGGWADGGLSGYFLDRLGVYPSGGLVLDGLALGITAYVMCKGLLADTQSDLIRLLAGTSAIGIAVQPLRKFCLIYHNEYPGLTLDVALFSVGILAASEVLSAPVGIWLGRTPRRMVQAVVLPAILFGVCIAAQECLLPWQFKDLRGINWRNQDPVWPLTYAALLLFGVLGFFLSEPSRTSS